MLTKEQQAQIEAAKAACKAAGDAASEKWMKAQDVARHNYFHTPF